MFGCNFILELAVIKLQTIRRENYTAITVYFEGNDEKRISKNGTAVPGLDQAFLEDFCYCPTPCVDVQFRINVFEMRIDGMVTDKELIGNLLFRRPVSHAAKNLDFPIGQTVFALSRCKRGEHVEDLPRDLSIHRRPAVKDFIDRVNDLLRRRAFQQIAGGTGTDRLEYLLVLFMNRQNYHMCGWRNRFDALHSFDPTHPRQPDIRQNDVW